MKKDKIVKKFNISRLPWEEAAVHSLGTTVLRCMKTMFVLLGLLPMFILYRN